MRRLPEAAFSFLYIKSSLLTVDLSQVILKKYRQNKLLA